ncbi:hypothetical protein ARALYDRAFT_330240 [Arabidopsis lyrata subsp. lyrata]|uniref:Neprosin PEP catalytic domain-containing protein n=1 Tax=Arabidopsis lyrata subsp. lyrata TaxID=81972 RepID=D7MI34_ARALL|nr:hypothetical protein ARALYDRAFT_330240 [Arabidopsis lyrata subsp. lyrata]
MFVNFVVILLSISYVESTIHMKSIKLSKSVIYDCMDIYEQPSLSHPLLKHHNIQLYWFSEYICKQKAQKRVECPSGTIPILRTEKENVIYSQEYLNHHLTFLTAQYPGTHTAGMRTEVTNIFRGVGAGINTYDLSIGKNQSSIAQTYVASQANDDANSIQVGWDDYLATHDHGRTGWLGKHGTCCFNVQCPGFVQVAKDFPLSEPLYNELFNLSGDGAHFVGFGRNVTSNPRGPSRPMGNGRLPDKDDRLWSASLDHLTIIDSNYIIVGFDKLKPVPLVDSNKCYDVHYLGYVNEDVGVSMSYGGPGGFKCGD